MPLVRVIQPLLSAALAACALLALAPARAAQVQVAVAANFALPMQKLAAAFERESGHQAVVSIGSTGRFYAQVRNGAPFHVLLAADEETPARLAREGFALESTRFTYATGRLVLWSAQPGVVDARGEVLRRPLVGKLAIADPRLAPYGAAAMQTLRARGVLDAVRPALVQGESIAQAHQFVASGNALLGFVALSQVQVDGRIAAGSAWIVPESLHTPLRQDAIVLAAGKDKPAAAALMRFLQGEAARALIRAHGYSVGP